MTRVYVDMVADFIMDTLIFSNKLENLVTI